MRRKSYVFIFTLLFDASKAFMKAFEDNFKDFQRKILENLFYYNSSGRLIIRDGTKYSIMDQVKFVKDSLQNIVFHKFCLVSSCILCLRYT